MIPISDSPRIKLPITNIIIIVFIIIIFLTQIFGDYEKIIYQYALIPSEINFNNITTLYRFMTAIFLHGDIFHLIFNMWFLWIFGDNIEEKLDFKIFLIIFFVSGLIGNLLQFLFMSNSNIPILGASGAIAGILGAYIILFPKKRIKTLIPIFGAPIIIYLPAIIMLGYWFILQVISVNFNISQDFSGIAVLTHIGGFISGSIIAYLYKNKPQKIVETSII